MKCTRKITQDLHYIGGSDRRLALFENIFPIPRGVSYNSYVLMDDKTVLLDTVDHSIGRQFLENLAGVLGERPLDYLIVNHMEPDHCALIEDILLRYPQVTVVGNAKTFQMIDQFFTINLDGKIVVVKEGDTLVTGNHTLHFVMAPMVHWPEAMVTYDEKDKVLFSADGFGCFGALDGTIFNDEIDFDRDWLDDARRYYTNIVGKYGMPVQTLLKKAGGLDIQTICPLHGPIWRSNLEFILDKYNKWSTYTSEQQGVMIAYASMYGNTENAANLLASHLADLGVKNIRVYDVSNTHVSQLISETFKYSHIVLAAPTYNGDVYPVMENYIRDMKALAVQNKTVALMENGTWAATASKKMKEILESMKNMEVLEQSVSVKSSVDDDTEAGIKALAEAIKVSLGA